MRLRVVGYNLLMMVTHMGALFKAVCSCNAAPSGRVERLVRAVRSWLSIQALPPATSSMIVDADQPATSMNLIEMEDAGEVLSIYIISCG